jgi:predicted enzyme related to lactoylglutathione lyase
MLTKKLDDAKALEDDQKSAEAISFYEEIIAYKFASEDDINDENVRCKEQAAYKLAGIFQSLRND